MSHNLSNQLFWGAVVAMIVFSAIDVILLIMVPWEFIAQEPNYKITRMGSGIFLYIKYRKAKKK